MAHGIAQNTKVWWAQAGPLTFEWHGWRLKLGLAFGPWYAGVLVGPLVLTLGRQQFFASPVERYEVAFSLLGMTPTPSLLPPQANEETDRG